MTRVQGIRSMDSGLESGARGEGGREHSEQQFPGPVVAESQKQRLASGGDNSGLGNSLRPAAGPRSAKPSSVAFWVILRLLSIL